MLRRENAKAYGRSTDVELEQHLRCDGPRQGPGRGAPLGWQQQDPTAGKPGARGFGSARALSGFPCAGEKEASLSVPSCEGTDPPPPGTPWLTMAWPPEGRTSSGLTSRATPAMCELRETRTVSRQQESRKAAGTREIRKAGGGQETKQAAGDGSPGRPWGMGV